MTEQGLFGVIVRVIGLVLILVGGYDTAVNLIVLGHFGTSLPPLVPFEGGPSILSLQAGVAFLAIGLYLLRGAPGLVSFAYPRQPVTQAQEDTWPPSPERPAI